MRVYGITKEATGIMEVENTLRAEQAFVGGRIEKVSLTAELDLICNEEGKINGLEPRAAWMEDGELVDIICGNFFICRFTEDGNFSDITDEDIPIIEKKLIRFKHLPVEVIVF